MQQSDGRFIQKSLFDNKNLKTKTSEDEGILLFDADKDGDLDLYIASGGFESLPGSADYADRFYINDGKANFSADVLALPQNFTSKFCVRSFDYDKDGDLDIFVSGRVEPWNYPKPVSSFIYRNDIRNGKSKFTDVTKEVAKDLVNIGLVCDAIFTDFDNDGWQDLILAGEWMPVSFFKNDRGVFKNVTASTGLGNQLGWWNTLTAGDFDSDGDIDYIAGNLGENSFYKASDKYPVSIYAGDFDANGSYDAFPSVYLKTSQQDESIKEYPVHTREDVVKQMISIRSTFQNYRSYAVAPMQKLLTTEQLKNALVLNAKNFKTSYLQNLGNGKFTMTPLPYQVQVSVINGMITDDFNDDGNLDVLLNGNDYGTEVSVGRYDALNGLLLLGNGKGEFYPQTILESGIFIPGNGKALVKLRGKNGRYLIAASQNRGPLKVFGYKKEVSSISIKPGDVYAVINYKSGVSQRQEFYYGSSFLSQSARFLRISDKVKSVIVFDNMGKKTKIEF